MSLSGRLFVLLVLPCHPLLSGHIDSTTWGSPMVDWTGRVGFLILFYLCLPPSSHFCEFSDPFVVCSLMSISRVAGAGPWNISAIWFFLPLRMVVNQQKFHTLMVNWYIWSMGLNILINSAPEAIPFISTSILSSFGYGTLFSCYLNLTTEHYLTLMMDVIFVTLIYEKFRMCLHIGVGERYTYCVRIWYVVFL